MPLKKLSERIDNVSKKHLVLICFGLGIPLGIIVTGTLNAVSVIVFPLFVGIGLGVAMAVLEGVGL